MSTTNLAAKNHSHGKKFNANEWMAKLKLVVRRNPSNAQHAYAKVANKFRTEANRPENRAEMFQLYALAMKLDELSAVSGIPQTDVNEFSGEFVSTFADHPGGDDGPGIKTEYDALVEDLEESKINEDGSENNDLVAAMRLEQLQSERENWVAQRVQITPAFKPNATIFGGLRLIQYGGSPAPGTAGNVGFASTGLSALQEDQIIRYDGRDQDTMAMTVALTPPLSGTGANYPSPSRNFRPYAHVIWGTSHLGTRNEAFVDVCQGSQFRVSGNFLNVNVGADAPPGSGSGGATIAGSMYLGGCFGFFSAASSSPVQRTRYVDALAASGTQNILIPAYATGLLPLATSDPAGQIIVSIKDAAGTVIGYYSLPTPGAQVTPIPLPSDAYSIDLQNNGLITANMRAMFQLSL